MNFGWHFNRVDPRYKNREATQGEFFATDTDLRAFVREAIQNSLDAKRETHSGPVAVRIFLSGETHAVQPEQAKPYFRGGWSHFTAAKSGLRGVPARDEAVRYLVYEDSGTTGLTGDVDQYHEVSDTRNPFYYFFRAEGQSNKSEADRGRWGLGKFVFPRCSRLRSFFALTVRHDDGERLLVGQSILRSHEVAGRNYTPDGWFGTKPRRHGVPQPVADQDFIVRFEEDFCLERKHDPGLSVVVPFCDTAWSADQVSQCVVEDYFYPILNDELVVTVEGPNSELVIGAESIAGVVDTFSAAQQSVITPLLDLTTWGMDCRAEGLPLLNLHDRSSAPRWSQKLFSENLLQELRESYSTQQKIAVRVPVLIRPKSGVEDVSHFDIFMEKAEGSQLKRPLFVREGILVSDVRSKLTRDLRSIVNIDDRPLARFLGDAENPAHTEWTEASSHFRGRYTNGSQTLRFIRNAVSEICQILACDPSEEDPRLLLDVFSIATDDTRQGILVDYEMLRSAQEKARHQRSRVQPGAAKPKAFRVRRRKGGFRIFFGDRRAERPDAIDVKVAYDRRTGNPLRRYMPQDFDLGHHPVDIRCEGAKVEVLAGNHLVIQVQDDAFDIAVTGFDSNRDLYLDVRVHEARDDPPRHQTGRK